ATPPPPARCPRDRAPPPPGCPPGPAVRWPAPRETAGRSAAPSDRLRKRPGKDSPAAARWHSNPLRASAPAHRRSRAPACAALPALHRRRRPVPCARDIGRPFGPLFFLFQGLVVSLDKLFDLVRHRQPFLPLFAIQGHGEAPHSVDRKRAL